MKRGVAIVFLALAAGIAGWGMRLERVRMTEVVIGRPVTVVSVDPVSRQGLRLVLPDELEVETVGGKGRWRAKAMEELGRKFGRKWAADSIADYLEIAHNTGSLGWKWWWLKRRAVWQSLDLEAGWVAPKTAPDGARVLELTGEARKKMGEWFMSEALASERLEVTVVNTVGVAGLGTHAAGVIENAGMKVAAIENSQVDVGECVVMGGKSLGAEFVRKAFGCRQEKGEKMGEKEVRLILGSDYLKWRRGDH